MRLRSDADSDEPVSSGGIRRFPLAAQPEIMRAAEKDDQYASFIHDACRDAFRHLFGTNFTSEFDWFIQIFYHSRLLLSGTRVALAYQKEVWAAHRLTGRTVSLDYSLWRFLLLLFWADEASRTDALLCSHDRLGPANFRRGILWHYTGFMFLHLLFSLEVLGGKIGLFWWKNDLI